MKIYLHDASGRTTHELDDDAALSRLGLDGEDHLWLEDSDEPLQPDATVRILPRGQSTHLHRGRGQITVTVSYNGLDQSRQFGPGTKVERVFDWACQQFGISKTDKADLVLRLVGTDEDLDPGVHIGTLAGRDHAVAFDLRPSARFAG